MTSITYNVVSFTMADIRNAYVWCKSKTDCPISVKFCTKQLLSLGLILLYLVLNPV